MSHGSPGETAPSGLWGARFGEGMAPEMVALNRSLDVDFRLWPHDVRGSRAWVAGLLGAGVLTVEEAARLREGLDAVARRLADTDPADCGDEDVHTLVERLLGEEVGALAGKLHTGRSRNDQVATDARLWGMEAVSDLQHDVAGLCRALLALARSSVDRLMPGYTHLQRGQPVRAAQWALSHVWPLLRDGERLDAAGRAAAVLPLGSGALAGCPFPVDREALAEELGFRRPSENSLDAVSDRDWACDLVYAGAMLGVHLSRLGEDLVLFASTEFGFLHLSDGYSTGSSLMPQKRNPDVAELARGKAGRLLGNLQALLVLLKGLPTGYDRDLQEDKEVLFDSVDTLRITLPAMAGAVRTAVFREERLASALDGWLLATDLADHLVRRGVPFRESHEILGALVRDAEERGSDLTELPAGVFEKAHPAFADGLDEVLSHERSVEARGVPGGTAREAVEAQIAEAETRLGS